MNVPDILMLLKIKNLGWTTQRVYTGIWALV